MGLMGLIAIIVVVVIVFIGILAAINFSMNEKAKQEADQDEDNEPTAPDQMNEEQKQTYKKKKQDEKWNDPNEHAKYVCQGGKVECAFCSPTFADIIVTSTTIKLQDKPWATVEDKDGIVNFNFTGVCKHPSQQKPGAPPPPCKAVISLDEWKNFSETQIDGKNALIVQSTIPCMISGQDLKIIDSGQRTTLSKIEPDQKKKPKVVKMYWMDEKKGRRLNAISKGQVGILCVQTEYFLPEETKITIPLKDEEGEIIETLEGDLNSDGWAYIKWPKIDNGNANSATTEKKKPQVVKMYWMDEKKKERIDTVSKGQNATLCIQTKDFLPDETKISIPLKDKEGEILETLKGNIGSDGWAYIKWTNKINSDESNSSMGE